MYFKIILEPPSPKNFRMYNTWYYNNAQNTFFKLTSLGFYFLHASATTHFQCDSQLCCDFRQIQTIRHIVDEEEIGKKVGTELNQIMQIMSTTQVRRQLVLANVIPPD